MLGEARRLVLPQCELRFDLFSAESLAKIVQDTAWLQSGAAIFLWISLVTQLVLIMLAGYRDLQAEPMLEKLDKIRQTASAEFYRAKTEEEESQQNLPAYEDWRRMENANQSGIFRQRSSRSKRSLMMKKSVQEAEHVRDASRLWAIRLAGKTALRLYFSYSYGGLGPDTFRHIRQQEVLSEAANMAIEFCLLRREQQCAVVFATSTRLISGFFANYAISRVARIAITTTQIFSSSATSCLVLRLLGFFPSQFEECSTGGEQWQLYLRDTVVVFAIFVLHVPIRVAVERIRRENFIFPLLAESRCSNWCVSGSFGRISSFWLLVALWELWSLFVVVNFIVLASAEDAEYWIVVSCSMLLMSMVVRPMLDTTMVIGVWVASHSWQPGQMSDQMQFYIRHKKMGDDVLSRQEIETFDRMFAAKLLGPAEQKTLQGESPREDATLGAAEVEEGEQMETTDEVEVTFLDTLINVEMQAAEEVGAQTPKSGRSGSRPNTPKRQELRARRTQAKQEVEEEEEEVELESWTPLNSEDSYNEDEVIDAYTYDAENVENGAV